MPVIKVNELSAHYQTYGTGPTKVLILHGWGGSNQTWNQFIALAKKQQEFTWILPDLPGFGNTAPPPKPWTVTDYQKFCTEFRNKLSTAENWQIEFLLTHSFGGRIAAKWLNLDDHQFTKAILTAAAGLPSKPSIKQKIGKTLSKLKNLLPAKIQPTAQKALYKLLRIKDFDQNSVVMQETFKQVVQEDLTNYFSKIKIPITLVWGKKDTYTPYWQAQKLTKLIPHNQLISFTDVRHGIHKQAIPELIKICQETFSTKS